MGGVIATLFAGTFPERVTRLAVLEGAGPPDNPWEAGPQRMRRWIDQVRASRAQAAHASGAGMTRDEALKRLTVNHPQVATSVLESRLAALADSRQDGVSVRYKWCFDPVHRTTSPTPFFAKLFVEFAKRVTCPVLFVSGGPTGYHTPDEADRILAFHECAVCELHNAGHMMHWTQPEALSDGLLKHLGSLPEICDTP
jgi:pimeloyl-ACP methyl ester carboxylesterase